MNTRLSPIAFVMLFLACMGCTAPGVTTLTAVAPTYPPLALTAAVSSQVRVLVTLTAEGTVRTAQVTTGHPLLDRAAVSAAKRWTFNTGGEERQATLTFAFEIISDTVPREDNAAVFLPPFHVKIPGRLPKPTVNYRDR